MPHRPIVILIALFFAVGVPVIYFVAKARAAASLDRLLAGRFSRGHARSLTSSCRPAGTSAFTRPTTTRGAAGSYSSSDIGRGAACESVQGWRT